MVSCTIVYILLSTKVCAVVSCAQYTVSNQALYWQGSIYVEKPRYWSFIHNLGCTVLEWMVISPKLQNKQDCIKQNSTVICCLTVSTWFICIVYKIWLYTLQIASFAASCFNKIVPRRLQQWMDDLTTYILYKRLDVIFTVYIYSTVYTLSFYFPTKKEK